MGTGVALAVLAGAALTLPALGQKLFFENFDSLPLGPNPEEASKGAKVWTRTPPPGWSIDDSGMPGYGTPEYAANDGMTEWSGWAFADVKWWPTVDNQRRSEFTRASGAAAIADPDEWDDATHLRGLFNSYLTTPPINVAGKAANSLVLTFDSSWRPEGRDDTAARFPVDENGQAINNQTAVIFAKWDNADWVEVMRWDSISDSPYFKRDGDFINEAALVELKNPTGAQTVTLKIGMIEAANDWWWAFDNLALGEPPLLSGLNATGIGFTASIREALGKTVNDGAPITATLDGQTITVTSAREEDTILVSHDQSPRIFTPGSKHTVEITFRTGAGQTLVDTGEFIAPSYTAVSSTPTVITASISENSYLAVDETKGIRLELDGATVTPQSVSRVDLVASDGTDLPDRIDVRYTSPTPLTSGSVHALKLTFTTKTAQEVVENLTFSAPVYVTLPETLGTAVGTGSSPGMRWRTHQLSGARPANNLATVERQLAGELGPSVHDPSGQNASGYFDITNVNFEQDGAAAGNFNGNAETAELAVADEYIPGIPGLEGGNDNIAGEALAYIELPAPGVYTMVVNSDDGFGVTMGNAANPTFLELGKFDSTRGAANTTFYFGVSKAGVYLFRLLWFEGGSGASVEWFTVDAEGKRALVNGPTGTGVTPLRAFKQRTVAEPELPASTPTIGIARSAGNVVVTYTGTLQGADLVTGPFSNVAGATSPYTVPTTGAARFYRSAP